MSNHKKRKISEDFFFGIELKLCTVVTSITKFHVMSPVTNPRQHKGSKPSPSKVENPLPQTVLYALDVHSIGTSTGKSQPLEQQMRHFSFWEGRGLVKASWYGDIITTITMCRTSFLQNFNPVAFTEIFHILLFYTTLCPPCQKSCYLHKSKSWITQQPRMLLQ